MSEKLLAAAIGIERAKLSAMGTLFGKFTKTGRFNLNVTCLDYLAQYAKVRFFHARRLTPPVQGLGEAVRNYVFPLQ